MDAEAYPQEILADEEPKYLRRQKPLEIKRRKFGRKAWKGYLRVSLWAAIGIAGAALAYFTAQFLLHSPAMALLHPEQIRITRQPLRAASRVCLEFLPQIAKSAACCAFQLSERRRQIESLPWVEQATVRRALPNRVEIEIVERTPIAFLRDGSDMSPG